MRIPAHPKVILRHCPTYDVERIRRIVGEGLDELGKVPQGRTLIKPNVVSSGPLFAHAHTRVEFVEGVILALRDRGTDTLSEIAVGERSGITIPTRYAFENAGYYPMFARTGAKHYHFEEERQVEVRYRHEGRLRDYVFVPEPVARADFFVNCPKFKAHPWTTVTFSMKNYIGLQDDRHRMIDHDHRLNEKVADLQYVIQPEVIAADAITAGEGRMLTPLPFELGLVILGNSQVALDAVCCAIVGIRARDVDHIRLAAERGFGPLDLGAITISGDVTLEDARRRAQGFRVGLIRADKYFEGTNISAYVGPPPEAERTDYCWGGCPGAIEEAVEILRAYDAECDRKMPRMHVVFGAYNGPIPKQPGEMVVFIGDCVHWEGTFRSVGGESLAEAAPASDGTGGGALVRVESLYRDGRRRDPLQAKHEDIYAKMLHVTRALRRSLRGEVLRLEGCPVSVAEQVLVLAFLGHTKNPYLSPDEILRFNRAYLSWRSRAAGRRISGIPYQVAGEAYRGRAAPDLEPEASIPER